MENKNLRPTRRRYTLLLIILAGIILTSLALINTIGSDSSKNQLKDNHFISNTISVGSFPVGISVNPSTNVIYVTNNQSGTVSVIDGETNSIIKTIKVGDGPAGISVNPLTDMIYVANYYSDTISVIDGKTHVVVKEIPVDNTPWGIDLNSENNIVYTTNYFANTISIIDGIENNVITTVKTDKPWGIDVNSHTGHVFVANRGSVNVSTLKGDVMEKIAISDTPFKISPNSVSYNEKTNLLYVANSSLISVIDISTNSILEPISVGMNLVGLTINSDTNMIYASDIQNDIIYIIDGSTHMIKEEIKVGDHPIAVEINPETNTIYVVNEYSNSISVIIS